MNKQQRNAIRRLERALKACSDAGLAMIAECNNLHITHYTDDLRAEILAGHTDSVHAVLDDPCSEQVEHHGVFLDCGAV